MEFRGKYWFLSNSSQYPFDYKIGDKIYRFQCVDAAFEASKCPERAEEFVGLLGKEAKALGKTLKKKEIRSDWNDVKLSILKDILREKFIFLHRKSEKHYNYDKVNDRLRQGRSYSRYRKNNR